MAPHIFSCLRRFLLEEKGYSKTLAEAAFKVDFGIKGLVLDKELGNFLRFDSEKKLTGHDIKGFIIMKIQNK